MNKETPRYYNIGQVPQGTQGARRQTAKGQVWGYNSVEKLSGDKLSNLAKKYIDLPKGIIEGGIAEISGEIENLPAKENISGRFLKSMIDLEMYDYFSDVPNQQEQAEKFLADSFQNLSAIIAENENFEINYQNHEGKKVVFGNLSLAHAYLGDMYLRRYFKIGNYDDWRQGARMYENAIALESDRGRRYELKLILAVRKIIENFGNEQGLRLWKTTRRSDLRGQAADFKVDYRPGAGQKIISRFVDAAVSLVPEKQKKSRRASVFSISEKSLEQILQYDFQKPLVDEGRFKSQPRAAMKNFIDLMPTFFELSDQLESFLEIRNIDKPEFRKNFFINYEKLKQRAPGVDINRLDNVMSQWWQQ